MKSDIAKAKIAYKIIKKYFSTNELREEKKLYDIVVNTCMAKSIDDTAKFNLIEEAYKHYDKINKVKSEKTKDKLIKEINYRLGKSTYNIKLDNYRLNALVNSLWNTKSRMDRMKYLGVIKDELSKLKGDNKLKLVEIADKANVDTRILNKYVLNVLVSKYNDYVKDLLPEQKDVLKNYIDFVFCKKNEDEFGKYVSELKKKVTGDMQLLRENIKSAEIKHRVDDVCIQLTDMNTCPCKGSVEKTLKYIMEMQDILNTWSAK